MTLSEQSPNEDPPNDPVSRSEANQPEAPSSDTLDRLVPYGWDEEYHRAFVARTTEGDGDAHLPTARPARIISQHRGAWRARTEIGELWAVTPGRVRHRVVSPRDLPAVGDWVLVRLGEPADGATILEILPRRTCFVRKEAGERSREQVVATNIDVVFLMMSMNNDFNLRRLERYLVATRDSGAEPVVLLSKADLTEQSEEMLVAVEAVAGGAPVHLLSSVTGDGLDAVRDYLRPRTTLALLGSSGVGKSTLINVLAGEELLRTQEIRESDDRGCHTTTHRELFLLPGGALMLDTPGMRELTVWEAEERVVEDTFDDIKELAESCKFRDCKHGNEPGCAVRAALESGELDEARWRSHLGLGKELAYEVRRHDAAAAAAERRKWKGIQKDYRRIMKDKGKK